MLSFIANACKHAVRRVRASLETVTKPVSASLVLDTIADATRSRKHLIIENAMLRQQVIVLKRTVKKPKINRRDRLRLLTLARLTPFWQSAMHIVQPATLLRWHRDLFRCYWTWKSRSKRKQPTIPVETIALIQQMAKENRSWGAERIRGELLKLGIKVGKPTIQKYMRRVRQGANGHSQTWPTFLRNHAHEIWACDFAVVHDILFRPLYIFIVIAHHTREIVHAAITRHPTGSWLAQQLREATPWNNKPKYLIRDNDKKFGKQFSAVAKNSGIKELKTPIAAPRANALCERLIGSLRRECFDHVIILNSRQGKRKVTEYATYYNHHRPHQGIRQQRPAKMTHSPMPTSQHIQGRVISTPHLSGLHHSYAYAS